MLKCKPRTLISQYFADLENAFEVENWHIFPEFLVNFWLFFILISSFLDILTVFLLKIS